MENAALDQLGRWGLSKTDAVAARMFTTPDARKIYSEMPAVPAIVIPYHGLNGEQMVFERNGTTLPYGRVRLLGAAGGSRSWGSPRKMPRYLQPSGSPVLPYLWPGADWGSIAKDTSVPVILTEGEAKAIKGCVSGFTVIGLGGVFSFATKDGGLLPMLDKMDWDGRDAYIAYDSDAASNPAVLAAEARLVDVLQHDRGAKCHLVRLPSSGNAKVGLDDFLISRGPDALVRLLKNAPVLTGLDRKVMALNREIAWIEREGQIYDLHSKLFITKANLTSGSRFSSIKHITAGASARAAPKIISVATAWLTHPHAQRFDEILFRPQESPGAIKGESGRLALNMWTGFEPSPGDVQPFLDLNAHVFSHMRAEDRDLPLKTMIYKAQHPAAKIPLAVVMVGPEGSGKSLWGECIAAAFSPYSTTISPSALTSEFQGWLETSLIVLINEAKGKDMTRGAEILRSLISDVRREMNEKYRPARAINAYASYIITANDRAVGAFRADDRRMIVVGVPKPAAESLYDRVHDWKAGGGGAHLIEWMLGYDLGDWKPPARAPLSIEKAMAYAEGLSPVQSLAEEMADAGTNTIVMWLDAALAWARAAELSNDPQVAGAARATISNVQHYQVRPWYTPDELALMFPAILAEMRGVRQITTPAGIISRELRSAGVPYLIAKDDPRGFRWHGKMHQYLVISQFTDWEEPISQSDFERMMQSWPTYGQIVRGR